MKKKKNREKAYITLAFICNDDEGLILGLNSFGCQKFKCRLAPNLITKAE
jgi:hypothetical protein